MIALVFADVFKVQIPLFTPDDGRYFVFCIVSRRCLKSQAYRTRRNREKGYPESNKKASDGDVDLLQRKVEQLCVRATNEWLNLEHHMAETPPLFQKHLLFESEQGVCDLLCAGMDLAKIIYTVVRTLDLVISPNGHNSPAKISKSWIQ